MGNRVVYRTDVIYLPALGWLPPSWSIRHYCGHCHQWVETDQLITHAQGHDTANPQTRGPID